MTLDEAIERFEHNAEFERRNGNLQGCLEFRQLAKWLRERKMGVITKRERQKYFAYLDGVADGLNESRNDVNSVLDKIRDEINEEYRDESEHPYGQGLRRALQIIDKYRSLKQ